MSDRLTVLQSMTSNTIHISFKMRRDEWVVRVELHRWHQQIIVYLSAIGST